ncbi:MAG: tetratricopeptide repeat protein, partial [Candidatus Binatia bacterium]
SYHARREALEAALVLDPTRARWRLAYAMVLNALGRRPEALGAIEEAVHRAPELRRHSYLDPGKAAPPADVLEAVDRGFRRALAAHPGQVRLLGEAATFFGRFGRWADAAELWTRAGEVDGEWSRYGLRAGESYARLGDHERAEKAIRRAIGEDPARYEGYRSLALAVHLPRKDHVRAEEVLELGLRRARDRTPLWAALYEVRRDRGDKKAAAEALAEAAELEPRDPGLQHRLGRAYLEIEDHHRAKAALDRAIALEPLRASAHYDRGVALERLYDLGGARDSYARALELDPSSEGYRRSLERVERVFASPAP